MFSRSSPATGRAACTARRAMFERAVRASMGFFLWGFFPIREPTNGGLASELHPA